MSREIFIVFMFIFLSSFFNASLIMSDERDYFDIPSKLDEPKKETKPDIYTEYQRAQEKLWKDYLEIRNKLINEYISGKSEMSYKEFKSKEQSLRDIYLRGRSELLRKYLRNSERIPNES